MKTLLLIFTALLTFNTVAQSDYEEYRKGRFWGKAPISEEEQEQIDKWTPDPLPTVPAMMKMHPDQIRELEQLCLGNGGLFSTQHC